MHSTPRTADLFTHAKARYETRPAMHCQVDESRAACQRLIDDRRQRLRKKAFESTLPQLFEPPAKLRARGGIGRQEAAIRIEGDDTFTRCADQVPLVVKTQHNGVGKRIGRTEMFSYRGRARHYGHGMLVQGIGPFAGRARYRNEAVRHVSPDR